jgi:hypothetical protein
VSAEPAGHDGSDPQPGKSLAHCIAHPQLSHGFLVLRTALVVS